VLIVNQRGITWSLPKGHVDPGEDILTAAKREIYEESGVSDLTLIKKLGIIERESMSTDGTEKEQKTIHIFLFHTDQTELQPQDPHNPEAKWVKKGEVANILSNPKDREFFQSILNQF
jgi:ADP-ribose pyrophosphatase YjhB (NUDIX family)